MSIYLDMCLMKLSAPLYPLPLQNFNSFNIAYNKTHISKKYKVCWNFFCFVGWVKILFVKSLFLGLLRVKFLLGCSIHCG